jgi:hypothetical protein
MSNPTPPTKTIYVDGIIVGEVPATGDYETDLQSMRQFLEDKGLHRETTKVQAMFRQALSFATTAAHLHRTELLKAPRNGLSVTPFVVNSAFAIELYLKALHELQATNPGREHHLLKLYEGLTPDTQSVVIKHAMAEGRSYGAEVTSANQFREFVEELDSAFVDWRYCYESGRASKITIQWAIVVMKAVHEACRELGAS